MLLPEGECKCEMTSQRSPNKGKHKPSWPLQEPLYKDALSTWEGAAPWDPQERWLKKEAVKSQRPIEAKDIPAGIVACRKKNLHGHAKSKSVKQDLVIERTTHPWTIPYHPILSSRIPPIFILRPRARMAKTPCCAVITLDCCTISPSTTTQTGNSCNEIMEFTHDSYPKVMLCYDHII